jgi:two-component system OmpR family sensor kinase
MTSADHDILMQIINALSRFDHPDRLLRYVVRAIRRQMTADGAAVLFLDKSGSELYYQLGSYADNAVERRLGSIRFPADKGAAGEICRTGRPLIVNDYGRSPYVFRHVDEQIRYETRSMLGVPMQHKGRVVGVLCLVNKIDGFFNAHDAELLHAVADVTTLAVEYARSQNELAKAMARIATLNQAKEEAIVHLSHELKTPLAVLSASLKLLKRAPFREHDADWHSTYDRAQRNLERLLNMAYAVEDCLRRSDDVTFDAMTYLPQPHDPPPEKSRDDDFFQQVNIEFLIHELKDPLSIIETNTRMLSASEDDQGMSSRRRSRTLQRILRGTVKVRSLLEALLEVGRAEAVCFDCRPFNPFELVKQVLLEVVESHAADIYEQIPSTASQQEQLSALVSRGIRIEAQPAAESARMVQDETKVRQIVANLLKNALSYRRSRVLLNLTLHRDKLTLAVRDDGPGIAEEHMEKIFERYKQVSPWPGVARHGHGLGLAVSRLLARSMDGDIVVDSQLGQGALFKLTLPLEFDDGGV